MQKQKIKKISAKLLLAIFIINAVCIFNFATPALAAGEMNIHHDIPEVIPSTYSFDNDAIGSNPSGWTTREGYGWFVQVINEPDVHAKVVEIYDRLASGYAAMFDDFSDQTYGTIEYWIKSTDESLWNSFELRNGGTRCLRVTLNADHFQSGSGNIVASSGDNTWYHVRIDFETTLNGYMGLGQYEYKVHINGIEYGNYAFETHNAVNRVWVQTSHYAARYYFYLDAIGYSWDPNYNVGDNLMQAHIDEGDSVTITWEAISKVYEGGDGWFYSNYYSKVYLKDADGNSEHLTTIFGLGQKSYTYTIRQAGAYSFVVNEYAQELLKYDHWTGTYSSKTGAPFLIAAEQSSEFLVNELLYDLKATPEIIHSGEETKISWKVNPKENIQDFMTLAYVKYEGDESWRLFSNYSETGIYSQVFKFDQPGICYLKVELYLDDVFTTSEEIAISVSKSFICATERIFPWGKGTSLTYSLQTINNVDGLTPKIFFGLSQNTFACMNNIEITISVDGSSIQSYISQSINRDFIYIGELEVDELKTITEHQIEIKIHYEHLIYMGACEPVYVWDNALITLEYLQVAGIDFEESKETSFNIAILQDEIKPGDEIDILWSVAEQTHSNPEYYYSIFSSWIYYINEYGESKGPRIISGSGSNLKISIRIDHVGYWNILIKIKANLMSVENNNLIRSNEIVAEDISEELLTVRGDTYIKIAYDQAAEDYIYGHWWGKPATYLSSRVEKSLRIGFGQYFPITFHTKTEGTWFVKDSDGYYNDGADSSLNQKLENWPIEAEIDWLGDGKVIPEEDGGGNFDLLIMFTYDDDLGNSGNPGGYWDKVLGGVSDGYKKVIINLAWIPGYVDVIVGWPVQDMWSNALGYIVAWSPGVLSMIMHEVGHCFGLGDSSLEKFSVMDYWYHFHAYHKTFDFEDRTTISSNLGNHVH